MYKSLEHIIREIQEGKCCCEKKSDSLENAIRKVQKKEYESSYGARDSKPVEEDVGGLAGSGTGGESKLHAESGGKKKVKEEENDKLPKDYDESIEEFVVMNPGAQMVGRQFNTRAAIIAPRKDADDGHGQSAKNVAMQRRSQIQKFSARNVSDGGKIGEETISEAPVKFKEPTKTDFKIAPVAKEPKLPATTKTKDIEDLATKGVELVVSKTPMGRIGAIAKELLKPTPAGERVSEFERQKQYPVQPKLQTKPEVKLPEVKPETKVETLPVTKPEVKPEVKVQPKVPSPELKVEPKEVPKSVEEPKSKPLVPPTIPPTPPTKGVPPTPSVGGKKLKFPTLPYFQPKPVELTGPHAPVFTSVSKHRKHSPTIKEESGTAVRKSIQDMPRKDAGDRHNIEYVGRKDADPKTAAEKTSRQAQYKIKVIDEAKKLADVVKRVKKESDNQTKVFDNVVINPDLNRVDNRDPQN